MVVVVVGRHLAPEYFMHGVVDEKTDVFAFGVFLLELVSGKRPVDSSHQSLHSWVGNYHFSNLNTTSFCFVLFCFIILICYPLMMS